MLFRSGIHVAQLAELPAELIERAAEILQLLEQTDAKLSNELHGQRSVELEAKGKIEGQPVAVQQEQNDESILQVAETAAAAQLSFFDEGPSLKKVSAVTKKEKQVLDKLSGIEILDMTPLQAINVLYELQKKLRS